MAYSRHLLIGLSILSHLITTIFSWSLDPIAYDLDDWRYENGTQVQAYTCNADTFFGGPASALDLGLSPEPISKVINISPERPTYRIRFSMDIYRMGTWDVDENLFFEVNDVVVHEIDMDDAGIWGAATTVGAAGACVGDYNVPTLRTTVAIDVDDFNYAPGEDMYFDCDVTELSLKMYSTTTFNLAFRNESWGYANFQVLGDECDEDCACCDENDDCYICISTEFAIVGGICDPCDAPCETCSTTTANCITCADTHARDPISETCELDCPDRFYLQTVVADENICLECPDPFCLQCQDATPTFCDICNDTSFQLPTGECVGICPAQFREVYGPPNTCEACNVANCLRCDDDANECGECIDGFYVDLDTNADCVNPCPEGQRINMGERSCEYCTDPNCAYCDLDKDICTECKATHNLLYNDNSCYSPCPIGFTQHLTDNVCVDCYDPNCLDCDQGTFQCYECRAGYYYNSDNQSCQDDCSWGYRPNDDTNICEPCVDPNCQYCFEDPLKCEYCQENYFLNPDLLCQETCPEYYRTNITDRKCYECDDPMCVSCPYAEEICESCDSGYFSHTIRKQCYANYCGDGKRTYYTIGGNETCDDGNTNSGDGCSSSCQVEDGYVCVGGDEYNEDTCYEYEDSKNSPKAYIVYTEYKANEFYIWFSSEMGFEGEPRDYIEITFLDEDGQDVYNQYNVTIDDNDPSTGASRLRVIFEMNQEFSGLTMKVKFTEKTAFYSRDSGKYIKDLEISKNEIFYAFDTNDELQESKDLESPSIILVIIATTCTFIHFWTGDFELFFNFMDTLQDAAYLQFSNSPLPRNYMNHVQFLDVGRYQFLYNYFQDAHITNDQNAAPAGFFERGVPNLFLFNIGKIIFLWTLAVIVYILAMIIAKITNRDLKFFRKLIDSPGEYVFNVMRTSQAELAIFCMLQYLNIVSTTKWSEASAAFSILFSIPVFGLPFIMIYLQRRSMIRIRDQLIRNDTHFLYRELKTKDFLSRHYWIFYIMRRLLLTIFLVNLNENPSTMIILISILLTLEAFLLLFKQPFKNGAKNFRLLLAKAFLLLQYLLSLSISISDLKIDPDQNMRIGRSMYIIQMAYMSFVILIALYLIWVKGVKPLTEQARIEPADRNMPIGWPGFEHRLGRRMTMKPHAKDFAKLSLEDKSRYSVFNKSNIDDSIGADDSKL